MDNRLWRGCGAGSTNSCAEHRSKRVAHECGFGVLVCFEDPLDRKVGLVRGHAVALEDVVGNVRDLDQDDRARNSGECNHPVDVLYETNADPMDEYQWDLVFGVGRGSMPV